MPRCVGFGAQTSGPVSASGDETLGARARLCAACCRGLSAVVGAWLRSATVFSDVVVSAMGSAGSALLVVSSPP